MILAALLVSIVSNDAEAVMVVAQTRVDAAVKSTQVVVRVLAVVVNM